MVWPNGDTYDGEWVGGKQEGEGEEVLMELGETYTGEFVGGERQGKGTLKVRMMIRATLTQRHVLQWLQCTVLRAAVCKVSSGLQRLVMCSVVHATSPHFKASTTPGEEWLELDWAVRPGPEEGEGRARWTQRRPSRRGVVAARGEAFTANQI